MFSAPPVCADPRRKTHNDECPLAIESLASTLRRCFMARILICFAAAIAALSAAGCLGDRAADRTLTIYQLQSTETYTGQFQIDTSQLPPGAVEMRVDDDSEGVPVTSLTIDQQYPIRVVLVPATQP
jgi:hypothetical protein